MLLYAEIAVIPPPLCGKTKQSAFSRNKKDKHMETNLETLSQDITGPAALPFIATMARLLCGVGEGCVNM